MTRWTSLSSATTVALALSLGVSGCATTGGSMSAEAASSSVECNEWLAAGIGAVLGGALAGSRDRLAGAAAGATVGVLACIAFNHYAQQTKSARQVQEDYQAKNAGRLPETTKLVRYDSRIEPSNKVSPGKQVTLVSDIEVVQGSRESAPARLEEEIVLVRPDGKETKARKAVNEGKGAGAWRSMFTIKLPQGVPQGEYPVRTVLYIDGRQVGSRETMLQVVSVAGGQRLAVVSPF